MQFIEHQLSIKIKLFPNCQKVLVVSVVTPHNHNKGNWILNMLHIASFDMLVQNSCQNVHLWGSLRFNGSKEWRVLHT
jgi:hypothetical protein